jgi:biotin carboxylase
VLRGVSEIRSFFRTNKRPVYFVSPTPFNLLGMDHWARNFHYVNYYDSFDGSHPRVFVPKERQQREWQSMEEMNNYLLGHAEVYDFVRRHGPGKAVFVMFDTETEALASQPGLTIAHPSAELQHQIDSKILTTQIGNEAGVRQPGRAGALRRLGPHDVLHSVR